MTEEVPLTIEVNGKEIATLLCSPDNLADLVAGFLYTSGLTNEAPRPEDIVIDTQRWSAAVTVAGALPEEMVFKRIYTSGCGGGSYFHSPLDIMQRAPLADGFQIKAATITSLMGIFFKQFGGAQGNKGRAQRRPCGYRKYPDLQGRHRPAQRL